MSITPWRQNDPKQRISSVPSGARDRCPQKVRLSHTLRFDPMDWDPMDSDLIDLDPMDWDPMDLVPLALDPMDWDPLDLNPMDWSPIECMDWGPLV